MATGVPWLLKLEHINDKTIVIDVWFTVIEWKIYWDADFEEINNNWNLITPVPWGVGRLTVANLLKNTYKAFLQNR
jgi:methylenetetrahydrofolate dehydrogenase (NADP+)/methenyltetrahydrofolate cyclohydrolase